MTDFSILSDINNLPNFHRQQKSDHLFLGINGFENPVPVIGKQIIVYYFLKTFPNQTIERVTRNEFREYVDQFCLDQQSNCTVSELEPILFNYKPPLFSGKGQFSNMIEKLIGREITTYVEHPYEEHHNAYSSFHIMTPKVFSMALNPNIEKEYLETLNPYFWTVYSGIRKGLKLSSTDLHRASLDKGLAKAIKAQQETREQLLARKRIKSQYYLTRKITGDTSPLVITPEMVEKEIARYNQNILDREANKLKAIKLKEQLKEQKRKEREEKAERERIQKEQYIKSLKEKAKKEKVVNEAKSKVNLKTKPNLLADVVSKNANLIFSSQAEITKPVEPILNINRTTADEKYYYSPAIIEDKHKVKEKYIQGVPDYNVHPTIRKRMSKNPDSDVRLIKRRNLKKKEIQKIKDKVVDQVSPYELQNMIEDFLSKGGKVKVYDQVSENTKTLLRHSPDRKSFV